MDQEIFMVLIITILFLVFLWLFDEGFLLIIFGVIAAIMGLKFISLFPLITDADILFIFRLIFGLIAAFAIGKSVYMRKEILGEK